MGLGLLRERARIHLSFTRLHLPESAPVAFVSRLTAVDNARESVNNEGVIVGIRSTGTPGHRTSAFLTSLAALDPIALAFASAASATLLRFSEPEIVLPAGADMQLVLLEPITLPTTHSLTPAGNGTMNPLVFTGAGLLQREAWIRPLPYRTRTAAGNIESDLVNLLFVGDQNAVRRAFEAAGWIEATSLTAAVKYRTLRALAENQGFPEAPMSTLYLNGRPPVLSTAKTLNSFSKRHHVRVFPTNQTLDGRTVLLASATHDIGLGFSKKKIVHRVNMFVDLERTKVVHDLLLTGCVTSNDLIDRPWIAKTSFNATDDLLRTDGKIAVLQFNDCHSARRFDDVVQGPPGPIHGGRAERLVRQTLLTVRNDLIRGNIGYQVWSGLRLVNKAAGNRQQRKATHRCDTTPDCPVANNPQQAGAASHDAPIAPFVAVHQRSDGKNVRGPNMKQWDPARVELGIRMGTFRLGGATAGPEGVLIARKQPNTGPPFAFSTDSSVRSGWSLGFTVTVHSHRWLSQELGYQISAAVSNWD